MRQAGLKNPDVAAVTGVHDKTVSKWRSDVQPPEEKHFGPIVDLLSSKGVSATAAWLRYGDSPPRVVEGAGFATSRSAAFSVGEAVPASRVLRSLPIREWIARFRLTLTRADVPEDEIDEAIALVTSPAVLTRYKGGKPVDLTEDEAIEELEALAEVVYARQRKAGRKFD
jgi:hypothetical protein